MWLRLTGLVFAAVGAVWLAALLGLDVRQLTPEHVRRFVLSFGVWAPIIYLVIYGQPIVPLPASILTLSGGLAFGPAWGALAAVTGGTIRACNQFFIVRLLGGDAAAKRLKGRAAKLDQRIAEDGFRAVLLIRLIPNVPFDMQNYLLGFSKIRFLPYLLGTVCGMIPGSFAYTYLGDALADPKNFWKLGLAIAVIAGLVIAQRMWQARHPRAIANLAQPGSTRAAGP